MKWCGLGFLLLSSACATTPFQDAASKRDWVRLEGAITEARQHGELSRRRVGELSQTVLEGEIANARGAAGVALILQLRSCARDVVSDLQRRAAERDAVGATAERLLIDLDEVRLSSELRRYSSDPDPYFRALAARSATTDDSAAQRRGWLKDGDLGVRRAALEAALVAKSEADIPDLLEATRLDPDPLNRSLAARSAAATGSEQVVLALRDYWPRASGEDRLTYVEAWASKRAFQAGGARELEWVVETEQGSAAIAAAAALLKSDEEAQRTLGLVTLSRALREGTINERQLAARLVPIDDATLVADLGELTREPHPEAVRVLAWQRLAELDRTRAQAITELRKFAQGKLATATARHALAELRDEWVTPSLRVDLKASWAKGEPTRRLGVAEDLVRVGDYSEAAILLADREVAVRAGLACFVVASHGD